MNPRFKRLKSALLPLALLPLTAGLGAAQDIDAKSAIDKFKQLPGSVQKVRDMIKGTNFGPFRISGSCGYDRQWYCFGQPCKTWNWWWEFPNYAWLKGALDRNYQNIQNIASQFDSRFAPVRSWLVTTLPNFSQQFDAAAARMQADDQKIRAGGSPADVEAAKKDIIAAIDQITTSLQQGSGQLQAGTAGLSALNQQLNAAIQAVNSSRAGMENMFQNDDKQMNQKLGDYPCGDGDARNQHNNLRNNVRSQFDAVVNAGQNFGVNSAQTDQGISTILGRAINLQNQYVGVLTNLRAARITPSAAIQQLRINVAGAQWRDLAAYARQQLGQ